LARPLGAQGPSRQVFVIPRRLLDLPNVAVKVLRDRMDQDLARVAPPEALE